MKDITTDSFCPRFESYRPSGVNLFLNRIRPSNSCTVTFSRSRRKWRHLNQCNTDGDHVLLPVTRQTLRTARRGMESTRRRKSQWRTTRGATEVAPSTDILAGWAQTKGRRMRNEDEIRRRAQRLFDDCYCRGDQLQAEERVLAALKHRAPKLRRLRAEKLPRMWRSHKGWKILCPPSACAVACLDGATLETFGTRSGALGRFFLVLVSSYMRSPELLRGPVQDPSRTVVHSMSLLMSPREVGTPKNAGVFSDSVLLNAPYTEKG